MEEHLDGISRGEEQMVPVLRDFYAFFGPQLQDAERTMEKVSVEPEKIGEPCPECGGDLVIKLGRFGKFVGCANYPTCRFTRPLVTKIGVNCPKDGGELVERRTRRGASSTAAPTIRRATSLPGSGRCRSRVPHCGGMLVVASKDVGRVHGL